MSVFSDQYAAARRDVLSRMRASWGKGRKEEEKKKVAEVAEIAWPFLEISDDDLDLASRVPSQSHLVNLADELRAIRAEKYAVLRESGSKEVVSRDAGPKRRELLEEIASEHFRGGMHSWLTSIAPDHGLSATPVVELEQIQAELQYRLKLLKALATMMEKEINAIALQIKSKRALEAGGPEQAG